ncbi:hypothetical protein MHUMG1_09374 [Metarhizium humberi]|uniref:Uncharacterized protein n=1 Tax=Metarhizium humberi TaxID=2596975 RepID=A0A9P8S2W6_9HYPO|nr:hypothetical protein MHUMG1_09374 [Metarhizium humberi]
MVNVDSQSGTFSFWPRISVAPRPGWDGTTGKQPWPMARCMRVGTEASSGEQNADGEYTLNGIGNRLGYPGDFPDTFYV